MDKQAEIARMYAEYEAEFPEVRSMTASELMERLDAERSDPEGREGPEGEGELVLVDVRPEAERRISMIPGAIPLDELEADPARYAEATIVTYCTVGYRSGLVARELQDRGYEVLNLHGSLLSWTHAGGELIDSEGTTDRVHVYGKRWDLAPEGYRTTW